jgi:NAD(P)-dependent dehydrogenase (short-subunit alcohol dehydrogenase family)
MSAQRFQGKIAVVTGGNSGIGLGVAKAYAQEGARVAITGRNEKTLESAAKGDSGECRQPRTDHLGASARWTQGKN